MSYSRRVLIFFLNYTKNSKTKCQPQITWIQIPLDSPCNSCLPSSLCFVSAVTLFTAFRLCQMMSRPTSNSTLHMVSCGTFRLGFLHICDPYSGRNAYVMVPQWRKKKKTETHGHHRGCEPSTGTTWNSLLVISVTYWLQTHWVMHDPTYTKSISASSAPFYLLF